MGASSSHRISPTSTCSREDISRPFLWSDFFVHCVTQVEWSFSTIVAPLSVAVAFSLVRHHELWFVFLSGVNSRHSSCSFIFLAIRQESSSHLVMARTLKGREPKKGKSRGMTESQRENDRPKTRMAVESGDWIACQTALLFSVSNQIHEERNFVWRGDKMRWWRLSEW